MKKLVLCVVGATLLISCGATKSAVTTSTTTPAMRQQTVSLEGETVIKEVRKSSGVAMAESLSEDGLQVVQHAYRWFAGSYTADNEKLAKTAAKAEARAEVSRSILSIVKTNSEAAGMAVDAKVHETLTTYWKQQGSTILNGCEDFGEVEVEYNPSTRMYKATAKVAMRGDRYNKVMESAGSHRPQNLSEKELDDFIALNKKIIEAAKAE